MLITYTIYTLWNLLSCSGYKKHILNLCFFFILLKSFLVWVSFCTCTVEKILLRARKFYCQKNFLYSLLVFINRIYFIYLRLFIKLFGFAFKTICETLLLYLKVIFFCPHQVVSHIPTQLLLDYIQKYLQQ